MSKRFSLGRADAGRADVLLVGSTISAKHAEVTMDGKGALLLSDLGSSNGTSIVRNGKTIPVSSSVVSLLSSDLVSLGGKKFTVDEVLSKLATASVVNKRDVAIATPSMANQKMMRCLSCGCVTPQGSACLECGYVS